MGRFDSIKKSRKKSKDIDEKIEYLNKELCKTGLDEMMTTTKVYQGVDKVPNTNFSDFEGLSLNGLGLGLSGGDGNGAGDAFVGEITLDMRLGHAYTGMKELQYHLHTQLRDNEDMQLHKQDLLVSFLLYYQDKFNVVETHHLVVHFGIMSLIIIMVRVCLKVYGLILSMNLLLVNGHTGTLIF